MVDDATTEAIKEAIKNGLEEHLSKQTAGAIVDAIDLAGLVEALTGEDGFQGAVNAVNFKQLGGALGGLIGGRAGKKGTKMAAKKGIGNAVPGGKIGVAVGGVVGERAVKILIEHIDWEMVEEEIGNRLHEVKVANLNRIKHFPKTVGDTIPRVGVSRFWSKTDSEDEDDRTGLGAGGTIDG